MTVSDIRIHLPRNGTVVCIGRTPRVSKMILIFKPTLPMFVLVLPLNILYKTNHKLWPISNKSTQTACWYWPNKNCLSVCNLILLVKFKSFVIKFWNSFISNTCTCIIFKLSVGNIGEHFKLHVISSLQVSGLSKLLCAMLYHQFSI